MSRLDIQHRLYFAYAKHLWFTDRKEEAMSRLTYLGAVVDMVCHCERVTDTSLRVACWLALGEWKISYAASPGSFLTESLQAEVLTTFKRATMLDHCGYRAWHAWALLNLRIVLQQSGRDGATGERVPVVQSPKAVRSHVVAAVKGFVNAVCLGSRKWSASVQQDLLNLLTCLFKYGKVQDVASVINECIGAVAIEAWLGVLPQLLARIHIKDPAIRAVLHPLLIRLGEKHPQALMYPLSVLLNSPVAERKASAESLMNSLKAHSSALVEEAQMVSSELIRVAILWLEMWHEGLEDASRLYFGEGNVSGMLDLLSPLHEMLEQGAETQRENDFLKSYGQDLAKAHLFIQEYAKLISEAGSSIPSGQNTNIRPNEEAETAMNRAWGT
jgi:FKBP12-rapamycin complex-associated protein